MPKLRNRVKDIRIKKNLNQSALAKRAGTAQQTISDIETGRRVPSVITALLLAQALGESVETLFFWEE